MSVFGNSSSNKRQRSLEIAIDPPPPPLCYPAARSRDGEIWGPIQPVFPGKSRPPILAVSTEKAGGVERVYFCKPLDRICDESGMERNFLLSFLVRSSKSRKPLGELGWGTGPSPRVNLQGARRTATSPSEIYLRISSCSSSAVILRRKVHMIELRPDRF